MQGKCWQGRSRFWLAWALIVSTVFWRATGFAEPALSLNREFHVTHWNSEDGLPQNLVRAILQTRDGYLWLGTQFGLARFDGMKFTVFDRYNTPELLNDAIATLSEDRSRGLWIGTGDGVYRHQQGGFLRTTPTNELPGKVVWSVYGTRRGGDAWLIMDLALVRLRGGKAIRYQLPNLAMLYRHFRVVREEDSAVIWVGGPAGLFRFDEATDQFLNVTPAGSPTNALAWLVSKTHPGRLWVFCNDGIRWLENGRWSFLSLPGRATIRDMPMLMEDLTGALWIGGREIGLKRLRDGKVARFEFGERTSDCDVYCVYEDRERNIWVGTDSGLLRLTPTQVRAYTKRDGLEDNFVWSVSPARAGGVWVSTRQGLNWLRHGVAQAYEIDSTLGVSTAIGAVLEDDSGTVWLGRNGFGREPHSPVLQFRDGVFTEFHAGTITTSTACRCLYLDRSNRVWLATRKGVLCWRNGVVAEFHSSEDPFYDDIRAMYEARDGSMWFGSYSRGLRRSVSGRDTNYRSGGHLASDSVWSFHEDVDGVIWIGTENGLHRFEDGRFAVITRDHGLHENIVNHILEDDAGNLWLSGLRGIYRLRRQHLNEVAAGRTNACQVVTIGEPEGMENAETNGENQPAGCRTTDGQLWFPTLKGVVAIDPKSFRDLRLLPPVVIEQVLADDQVVLREGVLAGPLNGRYDGGGTELDSDGAALERPAVSLAPGRARTLEVRYTANSFNAPERVRFKYRLEGHDPDWRDAGDRRVAFYTNLRPGQYRFRVIVGNSHGHQNETGASFDLTLAPHFYETWPFYFLCGALVVGVAGVFLTVRLRIQRQFLRLEQQAELERVRARIAEDMHDDIGASLSQIAILSEVARRDLGDSRRAESNVERISGIARRLVDSLSELVWATNPRNDTLDNMAAYFREYAANYFEPTAIECRLNFPADLPPMPVPAETRRALFLGLKEALHNVVRHSRAREVEVGLSLNPIADGSHNFGAHKPANDIRLFVRDDGRGLPPDREGRRFGNGLRNMRRRIEAVGGATKFQSDPGQGTRVSFIVPLRKEAT